MNHPDLSTKEMPVEALHAREKGDPRFLQPDVPPLGRPLPGRNLAQGGVARSLECPMARAPRGPSSFRHRHPEEEP